MYKTLLLAGIGIAFAALPLVSSAQTVTATVASPVAVSVCSPFNFNRSLYIGVTGGDVTELQQFLVAQGYLNVSPTGYFGVLTHAAVARWQANGGVAAEGSLGSGIFGPLSRAYFSRICGTVTTAPSTESFTASPQSGPAPLTVQFTSTAPQGTNIGNNVNFGDGTTGTLAFAPTCSNCNALAMVSHTYTTSGTYTASLMSGNCACPANGICNCPNMQILATTTVTVGPTNSTASIEQLNAPANVTLAPGGIAEVRNESYYFTLESLSTNSATIQITPVGCWNSFPSDTPPQIRCMLAPVPIPLQTFSVGQNYTSGDRDITLTAITNGEATFSVNTPPTAN